MKRLVLFTSILLMSAAAVAAFDYIDVNADDGISYDRFVEKIKAGQVKTLEDALKLVPEEFMRNYVLVYRSRSLQDANYLFPRAVVFGQSAKFMMSFNGHPKQRGYNKLEIIQFRENTRRFEFREITFNDDGPSFSEANPRKCLECHQSPKRDNVDPRPNWEPYNFWPGVYASVDKTIEPVLKERYEKYLKGVSTHRDFFGRFEKQDLLLLNEQAKEEAQLKKFAEKIKPKHERYRLLGKFVLRSPLNLTKAAATLNFRRIARLIKEDFGAHFENYKYSLLALAKANKKSSGELHFNCGDFLSSSAREKHLEYSGQENARNFADHLALVFEPLGVSTADWSMDFRTDGRFSAGDRFTVPDNSQNLFRHSLSELYPELQGLKCDELAAKNQEVFGEFERSGGLQAELQKIAERPAPRKRPLINRCIGCHVDYMDPSAPSIPFDNFDKLKSLLSQGDYARGNLLDEIRYRTGDHAPLRDQMPPSGAADRERRDELIRALEELVKSE